MSNKKTLPQAIIVAVGFNTSNSSNPERFAVMQTSGTDIGKMSLSLHLKMIEKANKEFFVESKFFKFTPTGKYYTILNAENWGHKFSVGMGGTSKQALNQAEIKLQEKLGIHQFMPKYALVEEEKFE